MAALRGRPQPVRPRARGARAARPRSPRTRPGTTASTSTRRPRSWSPRARPRRSPPRSSRWWTPATRWSCSSRSTTPTSRCIEMAGGVRRPVTLRAPDFRLDVDALRAAVSDRTAVLLLNSPHNPTGTVLTRAELEAVAEVAVEHDLVVVTDEVYEHLVYDDHEHVPLCTLPGMWDRTRVDLQRRQDLLVHRLEGRLGDRAGRAGRHRDVGQAVADLHQRRSAAAGHRPRPGPRGGLLRRAGAGSSRASGTCSARGWPRWTSTCGRRRRRTSSPPTCGATASGDGREFCLALPERAGVVAIPTQGFYDDQDEGRHRVRWAFCKETAVIEEGLRRLHAADLHA